MCSSPIVVDDRRSGVERRWDSGATPVKRRTDNRAGAYLSRLHSGAMSSCAGALLPILTMLSIQLLNAFPSPAGREEQSLLDALEAPVSRGE